MCKYCEKEIRFDVDSDYNTIVDVEDDFRGPQLYFGTTIDGGSFGYVDVEAFARINFCPMCGRQLREKEDFIK